MKGKIMNETTTPATTPRLAVGTQSAESYGIPSRDILSGITAPEFAAAPEEILWEERWAEIFSDTAPPPPMPPHQRERADYDV